MKFAVVTDVHGNLEALNALLKVIKANDYDEIISLGDAIAIGPHPEAVMKQLIKHDVKMIMGNHEQYYLMDEKTLSEVIHYEGELNHQRWVKKVLGDQFTEIITNLPWMIEYDFKSTKVYFMHYAIDDMWFKDINGDVDVSNMKTFFNANPNELYIFGHHHPKHEIYDQSNNIRYLNPGSAGCTKKNETTYLELTIDEDHYEYKFVSVSYDLSKTLEAFDQQEVAEKEFIKKVFFGCK